MNIYREITEFIFREDKPQKADVIFIPGGPYPELAENAARLYREGWAEWILPSGKYSILEGRFAGAGSAATEWEYLADILGKNGVPREAVLREDQATFTYENAIFSREVLQKQGMYPPKTAILCCQAFHARRSLMYYQDQFPDTRFLVCPAVTAGISKESWQNTPEGIEKVMGELRRIGTQFPDICRLELARRRIRACIFDLDGTLADTVDSMAYSANRALAGFGLPALPRENFRYYAGDGADMLVKRCLVDAGDTELSHYEKMRSVYRAYFAENCMYRVLPYPGITGMLEELKRRGIPIAVLSNKPHLQAIRVVEELFGKGVFDWVQGQTEEIPRKPDPTGALHIAERFGVSPEECLYLGDTNTDMQTGKRAGMYTTGVSWGFRSVEELRSSGADQIIHVPAEVLKLMGDSTDD